MAKIKKDEAKSELKRLKEHLAGEKGDIWLRELKKFLHEKDSGIWKPLPGDRYPDVS